LREVRHCKINALAPLAFVILLGWLAGRYGVIASAASSALAVLVLHFCLPADLFIGTASVAPGQLDDWRFLVAIAVGLLAIYLAGLVIALVVFRLRVNASALQALNGSFPNMAFMGIPVLTGKPDRTTPVLLQQIGRRIARRRCPRGRGFTRFLHSNLPAAEGPNGSCIYPSDVTFT